MNKRLKNVRGITLVVLVITVIILLILAGVSIYAITGQNGLLEKTKQAKEKSQKETAAETINLKITEVQLDSYSTNLRMPTLQDLANAFCNDDEFEYVELTSKKQAALPEISVGEATSIFVKLKAYPYEFEINGGLELATIDGVEISEAIGDSGSTEDSGSTGDTGTGSTGSSDFVSTEEYESKIAELTQEIENLKSSQASLQSTQSAMNTQIESLQGTTGSTSTSKLNTLWTGSMSSGTIELSDSIYNYDFLVFSVHSNDASLVCSINAIVMIENDSDMIKTGSSIAMESANGTLYWGLYISSITNNGKTLALTRSGFGNYSKSWTEAVPIDKITGVKL